MPTDLDQRPSQPLAKLNSKARERERELNVKRITGIIACAECRRLRLRCDRKIPCSTCTRRGCKGVCPTGTMRTGSKENQALLGKISTISSKPISIKQALAEFSLTSMSDRICALEEALGIEVAEDHPLLSPELLAIKQGVKINVFEADEHHVHDVASEGGTLSISEVTGMRFLGASAVEASLLLNVLNDKPREPSVDLALPPEIMAASRLFPFSPTTLSRRATIALLIAHLPPYERAATRIEGYFKSLSLFMSPVVFDQMEELLRRFYPGDSVISAESFPEEDLHDLALFFVIMSNGFIEDAVRVIDSPEADMYMYLGRAALALRSVFEHGTMASVQAIFGMVSFYTQHLRLSHHEAAWKIMDLGLTIAMSIGLHLDPKRWRLDPEASNLRRHLFWEINIADKWRAIQSGRPQYFSMTSHDCAFPTDDGVVISDDGTPVESVLRWRHRFCRDVIAPITEAMSVVDQMEYAQVLKLDKLLRDFECHPFAFTSYPVPSWSAGPSHLHRHLRRSRPFISPILTVFMKEQAIQYLHRNFFARVTLEPSLRNPFHNLYAPSFLATYRSAVFTLTLCFDIARKSSGDFRHLNGLWTFALPCAVICGAVACRGTLTGFGDAALAQLEKTIEVFDFAKSAQIPRNSLPTLRRMRDKANESLRASKVSRYYESDSSSAFSLSAFCASDAVDSRPSTSSSERTPVRGGLDILSLEFDKPMEELLVLLGASRLHTGGKDREENGERNSECDRDVEARSRQQNGSTSTLNERSALDLHSHRLSNSTNGDLAKFMFEGSRPSSSPDMSWNELMQTADCEGTFDVKAFSVGETFPSFTDPVILEMFSDDSLSMGMDVNLGLDMAMPPSSSSAEPGIGAGRETANIWQAFMAEMNAMPPAQDSQKQSSGGVETGFEETRYHDQLDLCNSVSYTGGR